MHRRNYRVSTLRGVQYPTFFATAVEAELAKKIFKKYIYSEKTSPVDENGFPIPLEKGIANQTSVGLSVDIPANSFILYTTLDF